MYHQVGFQYFYLSFQYLLNILYEYIGFKRFEDPSISFIPQKIVFILLQLAAFGVALYKASGLGILPSAADWSSYLAVKQAEEISTGLFIQT